MGTKKTPAKKEVTKKVTPKKAAAKKAAPKKTAAKKVVNKEPEIKAETTEIKYQEIKAGKKSTLNVKKGKTILTKKGTSDEIAVIITKITKYNKLKDKTTVAAMKIRLSIESEISVVGEQKKVEKEKESNNIKTTKKILKKEIEQQKAAGVEEKEILKPEKLVEKKDLKEVEQIAELARHLRYVGYKHPKTGKTWNGERYV